MKIDWARQFTLSDIAHAFWKAKFSILATVLISVGLGLAASKLLTPKKRYEIPLSYNDFVDQKMKQLRFLSDYYCVGKYEGECQRSSDPFTPNSVMALAIEWLKDPESVAAFEQIVGNKYSAALRVNFWRNIVALREENVLTLILVSTDPQSGPILNDFAHFFVQFHARKTAEKIDDFLDRLSALLSVRRQLYTPVIGDKSLRQSESDYLQALVSGITRIRKEKPFRFELSIGQLMAQDIEYRPLATILSFAIGGFFLALIWQVFRLAQA